MFTQTKSGSQLAATPYYLATRKSDISHGVCGVGSQDEGLPSRVEIRDSQTV